MIHGDAQVILVDTPGVFAPKSRLDRAMVSAAWGGAADADAIAHVLDAEAHVRAGAAGARGADKLSVADAERVRDGLREASRKAVLVLNKVDLIARPALLELTAALYDAAVYDEVFMVSAAKGDGVEALASRLAGKMPLGPWLYPEDQVADLPLRLMAAEITREALFQRLHQEIPYASTVETESWKERKDGSVRVEQTIYVERESQRKIALGKDGAAIKAIGKAARLEMEKLIERPVHLFLFVKVRENWREDRARYRAMGLDFDV